jgi:hypothetical protein
LKDDHQSVDALNPILLQAVSLASPTSWHDARLYLFSCLRDVQSNYVASGIYMVIGTSLFTDKLCRKRANTFSFAGEKYLTKSILLCPESLDALRALLSVCMTRNKPERAIIHFNNFGHHIKYAKHQKEIHEFTIRLTMSCVYAMVNEHKKSNQLLIDAFKQFIALDFAQRNQVDEELLIVPLKHAYWLGVNFHIKLDQSLRGMIENGLPNISSDIFNYLEI